jgi:hypothetical protein
MTKKATFIRHDAEVKESVGRMKKELEKFYTLSARVLFLTDMMYVSGKSQNVREGEERSRAALALVPKQKTG